VPGVVLPKRLDPKPLEGADGAGAGAPNSPVGEGAGTPKGAGAEEPNKPVDGEGVVEPKSELPVAGTGAPKNPDVAGGFAAKGLAVEPKGLGA
jgi:hypothetical protein